MRLDASQDAICAYPPCRCGFKPKKPWQRFCKPEHRAAFHELSGDAGMRGIVRTTRVLKDGSVSVTLHFGIEEREGALQMAPGRVVEVL